VVQTISVLRLSPADAGAVRLAEEYATAIDRGGNEEEFPSAVLAKLGPALLAALTALGATPAARAAAVKGGASDVAGSGALARLRAAAESAGRSR
jgi:hypothetical protein